MAKSQTRLTQIQRQALSPLQKLSGELLELSFDQLNERIEIEKENNPYLEESEENTHTNYFIPINHFANKEQLDFNVASVETPLEDLLNQLKLSNINQEDYQLGETLIGNLNEKGYLTRELSSIAYDIYFETYEDVEVSRLEKVLKLIQTFEPAGIAARNPQECLLLQLQRKSQEDTIVKIAKTIIEKYWNLFSVQDIDNLSKQINVSKEEIEQSLSLIKTLNIYPGNIDVSTSKEFHLIPDITLWNDNGKIKYKLNKQFDRKFHINQESTALLQNLKRKNLIQETKKLNQETIKFLQEKIEAAQLFIDAYNNRTQTLHTFMKEIIKYQYSYFQEGDVMRLKPMKYEDIKQLTGFSESTLSRIANDKYIQTHFGTFKLRKLFTKSIETKTGEQISNDSVRNLISELINNENPQSPLTDQEILEQLQTKNINLARRTVTKYRQQLGIETAGKRKRKINE